MRSSLYFRPGVLICSLVMSFAALVPVRSSAVIQTRFGPPTSYPIGPFTSNAYPEIVITDFNNDGLVDLAVTRDDDGFSTMLGQGNGAFGCLSNYTERAEELLARDFNKDGIVDLVVASSSLTQNWAGNGDGSFKAPAFIMGYDTRIPTWIDALDKDGDGNLDYAVDFCFAHGRGDGTFEKHYCTPRLTHYDTRFRDVNQDGLPDMISATVYARNCSYGFCVHSNMGYGNFSDHTFFSNNICATHPYLELTDINRDLVPDVLLLNSAGPTYPIRYSMGVWTNNGDGTFHFVSDYELDFPAVQIAAADFNLDGHVDALVQGGSMARILYGDSTGGFVIGDALPISGAVEIYDFDTNDTPDIVYVQRNQQAVAVIFNELPVLLEITPLESCRQIKWRAIPSYSLEYSTNVAVPGSWKPFPQQPVKIGALQTVKDVATDERRFYRLKKSP